MLDIRENPSEMYMYGELNNKIKKILPQGLDTEFTEVIIGFGQSAFDYLEVLHEAPPCLLIDYHYIISFCLTLPKN